VGVQTILNLMYLRMCTMAIEVGFKI
jgi:hypothetical protein